MKMYTVLQYSTTLQFEPRLEISKDYFQDNYEDARELFLHFSKSSGAKIKSLVIDYDNSFNYIDIAIFEGKYESLLLHISGTHGVEGYVGSAIQVALLKNYTHNWNGPTVIMVHCLNPFGMKYLRRSNENNVDLNRNALFSLEEWNKILNRDINVAGYENLESVFNPYIEYVGLFTRLQNIVNALWKITTLGLSNVKRAMVTGTYSNPKGIFYGGNKLEKSHTELMYLLNWYAKSVKNLVVIDVHSGLGPMGMDTLMVSPLTSSVNLTNIFPNTYDISYIRNDNDISNTSFRKSFQFLTTNVIQSYELTMGNVADNYPKLFENRKNVISLTQEFGTYGNIWVGLSLIEENQGYHHGSYNQTVLSRKLYDTFCPRDNEYFTKNVLKRGSNVFNNGYNYLMKLE